MQLNVARFPKPQLNLDSWTPPKGNRFLNEVQKMKILSPSLNIKSPKAPFRIERPFRTRNLTEHPSIAQQMFSNTVGISPRNFLGLNDNHPSGKLIKIAVVDCGMNDSSLPNFDLDASIDFSSSETTCSTVAEKRHGQFVRSILFDESLGVAPKAKVLQANVSFESSLVPILLGLLWAVRQQASVVSISARTAQSSSGSIPLALEKVIKLCVDARCQIVAGTGSDKSYCSSLALSDKIIAVGGIKTNGDMLFEKFDGPSKTDCLALGERVLTNSCQKLEIFYGASAATPIVAGCLALFLNNYNGRFDELKSDFLRRKCRPGTPGVIHYNL